MIYYFFLSGTLTPLYGIYLKFKKKIKNLKEFKNEYHPYQINMQI